MPSTLHRASALALFLLAGFATAQDDPLEGHSEHGEAFNEGPRQSAYRIGGMGNVHFPVSDLDGRLQDFFDQGIGQLHGFWYLEAERTFRQIAAEAPECGMAYWGMAMANVDNSDRAESFARDAWLRRDGTDERERMYIDALAKSYGADDPEETEEAEDSESEDEASVEEPQEELDEEGEPLLTLSEKAEKEKGSKAERDEAKKRSAQLVKDYEEIVWEYPDDIEAKAFLVNRLWLNRRRGLPTSSRHANEALLQQVLAANPMHPAHHYRIHLWDAKDSAKRVVDSAVKSGPSAPGIAHMWHMGGHIFARLGRHTDAAWQQEASARVDHAHMMRDWVLPDQIHNFAHNNEWLTRSLRHHGRVRESVSLARNMIELPRHPSYNRLDKRGCSASYGRQRLLETLELFEQWEDLAGLAETMYLESKEEAVDGALRAFALGKAYAHLGDEEGFDEQVADLEAMLERSKNKRAETLDENEERALAKGFESDDVRAVLEDALDAYARELADVRNKLESLRALQSVLAGEDLDENLEVLAERRFDKSQLARLHLQAHSVLEEEPPTLDDESLDEDEDVSEAEASEEGERDGKEQDSHLDRAIELAREAIENRDGQLYPHATLAFVLHEAGETEEALEVFDELRAWTARADLDLPVFQRLMPLAELRDLPPDWRVDELVAEDVGERGDLTELGPLRWTPPHAPDWSCSDAFGNQVSLDDYAGRPVLVIFFLGFGCVHCVEQLVAFSPAYDDFEDMPLHGTFLVDGDGRMRWQDVSYEPFMDWEFLLEESQRLLGLDPPPVIAIPTPTPDASPLDETSPGDPDSESSEASVKSASSER